MSVVGVVPWRLVAQEAWRYFENMTRGHKKEYDNLESHMFSPLAMLPMTASARPKSKSGWALDPWKQGERDRLSNG